MLKDNAERVCRFLERNQSNFDFHQPDKITKKMKGWSTLITCNTRKQTKKLVEDCRINFIYDFPCTVYDSGDLNILIEIYD